jgi:YfiH family protein
VTPPAETAGSLSALSVVRHGFFGRRGGISAGPFASLNCSFGQGDDPAAVHANLDAVRAALNLEALAISRQVHGTDVVEVSAPYPWDARLDADAMVTARPGIGLGILTADCVPVLLADPQAAIIAAFHAGWRGALAGIAGATVRAMTSRGAAAHRIRAAIGPAISAANYEVGPQWAATLLARDPAFARYLSTPDGGREHFDLPRFVIDRLRDEGIDNPEPVGGCTYAMPEIYFSHRYAARRGASTGRQLAVIALVP